MYYVATEVDAMPVWDNMSVYQIIVTPQVSHGSLSTFVGDTTSVFSYGIDTCGCNGCVDRKLARISFTHKLFVTFAVGIY